MNFFGDQIDRSGFNDISKSAKKRLELAKKAVIEHGEFLEREILELDAFALHLVSACWSAFSLWARETMNLHVKRYKLTRQMIASRPHGKVRKTMYYVGIASDRRALKDWNPAQRGDDGEEVLEDEEVKALRVAKAKKEAKRAAQREAAALADAEAAKENKAAAKMLKASKKKKKQEELLQQNPASITPVKLLELAKHTVAEHEFVKGEVLELEANDIHLTDTCFAEFTKWVKEDWEGKLFVKRIKTPNQTVSNHVAVSTDKDSLKGWASDFDLE
jgi:hypothetical protein